MEARVQGRLGAAIVAAAAVGALAAGQAGSAVAPTIRTIDNPSLGSILVGATGRTVYHYADDHGTVVKCTGKCATLWPPVLIGAKAKPVAGPGISAARLGTV